MVWSIMGVSLPSLEACCGLCFDLQLDLQLVADRAAAGLERMNGTRLLGGRAGAPWPSLGFHPR